VNTNIGNGLAERSGGRKGRERVRVGEEGTASRGVGKGGPGCTASTFLTSLSPNEDSFARETNAASTKKWRVTGNVGVGKNDGSGAPLAKFHRNEFNRMNNILRDNKVYSFLIQRFVERIQKIERRKVEIAKDLGSREKWAMKSRRVGSVQSLSSRSSKANSARSSKTNLSSKNKRIDRANEVNVNLDCTDILKKHKRDMLRKLKTSLNQHADSTNPIRDPIGISKLSLFFGQNRSKPKKPFSSKGNLRQDLISGRGVVKRSETNAGKRAVRFQRAVSTADNTSNGLLPITSRARKCSYSYRQPTASSRNRDKSLSLLKNERNPTVYAVNIERPDNDAIKKPRIVIKDYLNRLRWK